MSGIVDRQRRAVVAGAPVLTGLLAVGDSACCTNPCSGADYRGQRGLAIRGAPWRGHPGAATLQYKDWAWLRRFSRGDGHTERYLEDLSRPGALTALPPLTVPTLGIWSTNDHYLDGEQMEKSADWVEAPWRYEVIEGASHWIPLDAPDCLNELLLDWLS
jgi:pimeloyl-ACP methyl ester carboxylesterase